MKNSDWRSSALWQALSSMRIEPEGAALTFVARLARENGWDQAYAEAVMEEYKRFLYLAAQVPEPVTPSEEVDQAWHLHLAYSRHYWGALCGEILRRPLHHGPTAGGEGERHRYRQQYEATLERYRLELGEDPPASIWPSANHRFSSRYHRVDASRYWLVPKAAPNLAMLAGAGGLVGACSVLAAAGGGGGNGLILGLVLVAAVIGVAVVAFFAAAAREPRKKDDERGSGCGGGGSAGGGDKADSGGDSGCGGGCGGCGS